MFPSSLPAPRSSLPCLALTVLLLALAGCAATPRNAEPIARATQPATLGDGLRARLAALPPPAGIDAATLTFLDAYYAAHDYAPLWVGKEGVTARGAGLLRALTKARDAGAPAIAPLLAAAESQRQAATPTALAELELALSAALLQTAIDPAQPTGNALPQALLAAAARSDDLAVSLNRYLPPDSGFWRLRAAIAGYRDLAASGGWPAVHAGPKLEQGMRDPRVAVLRARLAATGDLAGGATDPMADPETFDAALATAVTRFQRRHGLQDDGVVGADTLAALNVPAAVRLATMLTNLRRLAGAPRDWGPTYLVVNVAAAEYRLVEDGRTVMRQVTVVGQPDWQTPEIDSAIDRIVFNPYWTVPPRIARLELVPKAASDPDYLKREGIRQMNGMFRQDPGPLNPLGEAKFLFDNPYDVYLHDTNSPGLFKRAKRDLSHGCVRLPNALALAEYLLKDDPAWTRAKIDEVVGRGRNRGVWLTRPLPVHLVYDTAWVDEAGIVQFRPDIYGRDGRTEIAAIQ